jgi:uncharacterized protein (DUF1684 family)
MIWFVIFSVIALFVQTGAGEDGERSVAENKAWQQALLEERKNKDHEFKTSPTSPMAGLKRFNVNAHKKTFVMENNGAITLSEKKGTGAAFSLLCSKNKWYWECLKASIICTAGGKTLQTGAVLPGRTVFKVGRCTVVTYPSTEKLTLVVFDPKRPQIEEFSHLLYFLPDPKYAVSAVLEKFPNPEKIKILTSRNEIKIYHKYAKVRFQLDGKSLQLTAYKFSMDEKNPASKYLFIPFSDATSGKETYEVGRFLEIHEPESNQFILDFNRCFNPLCNYAPVYNCPVPPLENHLEIPIKAGEKTYPH